MLHTRSDELREVRERLFDSIGDLIGEVRAILRRILRKPDDRGPEQSKKPRRSSQPRPIPSSEATLTTLAHRPNATIELSDEQGARIRQIRDKAARRHQSPST